MMKKRKVGIIKVKDDYQQIFDMVSVLLIIL